MNSACALLLVNGVGANAQGPFAVSVPAGTTLSLNWSGPANQPLAFVATPVLVPGQNLGGGLVVDVNFGAFVVAFSGFDPLLGPLFFTSPGGLAGQTFNVPASATGATLSVQGVVFDTANTCSNGNGFMTTASFVVQF